MEIIERTNYKVIVLEPAKSRIQNGQCPTCGLHKKEWTRRTDWRCCSTKCTTTHTRDYVIYGWPDLRIKAFKRDSFTCVKCGDQPYQSFQEGYQNSDGSWGYYTHYDWTKPDSSKLIGDHIIPIALGGEEFDLVNVQTLCIPCDKTKTKKDQKNIGILRKKIKLKKQGQIMLTENFTTKS